MKIGIHDSENNGYPNLALMKISAAHKVVGDTVELFNSFSAYDTVYSSMVFTWTKTNPYLPPDSHFGGTGYNLSTSLPEAMEHICPDYSLYSCDKSYGFLTRGCPNKCSWCVVPEKEGGVKPHADVEEFARHKEVILMDNNVLACDHGIDQLGKIATLDMRVDFNQGLDARLIDDGVARRLGRIKWIRHIRLACDSSSQIESIRKAVELLRWHNANPAQIFCYVLVNNVEDALERVRFLKGLYVLPFAQPYRDPLGTEPVQELKDFARWVNHRAIYKKVAWEDYRTNRLVPEEKVSF